MKSIQNKNLEDDVPWYFLPVGAVKRFVDFLREDTWPSLIVSLVLAFIGIKFIFFPILIWGTGTALPLVIVESCSMYHSTSLENVMKNPVYLNYNLTYDSTSDWPFKHGLNKGDVIFAVAPKNLNVGDVLIFQANTVHPIIHRIVNIDSEGVVTTKGDNNIDSLATEKEIQENRFIAKPVFRIPYLGWIKLLFFEPFRDANERGFC